MQQGGSRKQKIFHGWRHYYPSIAGGDRIREVSSSTYKSNRGRQTTLDVLAITEDLRKIDGRRGLSRVRLGTSIVIKTNSHQTASDDWDTVLHNFGVRPEGGGTILQSTWLPQRKGWVDTPPTLQTAIKLSTSFDLVCIYRSVSIEKNELGTCALWLFPNRPCTLSPSERTNVVCYTPQQMA